MEALGPLSQSPSSEESARAAVSSKGLTGEKILWQVLSGNAVGFSFPRLWTKGLYGFSLLVKRLLFIFVKQTSQCSSLLLHRIQVKSPHTHAHTHTLHRDISGSDMRKQKNQVHDSCLAPLPSDHPIWEPVLKRPNLPSCPRLRCLH